MVIHGTDTVPIEEPALLTLGCCYEKNGRFAGGAHNPVLKRVEHFLRAKLPLALAERAAHADKLLVLDEVVSEVVKQLKRRGFESPYLRAFVVVRVNPLRFQRGGSPEFDATIEKMIAAARRFDAAKVRADQLAAAAGALPDQPRLETGPTERRTQALFRSAASHHVQYGTDRVSSPLADRVTFAPAPAKPR